MIHLIKRTCAGKFLASGSALDQSARNTSRIELPFEFYNKIQEKKSNKKRRNGKGFKTNDMQARRINASTVPSEF